MFFKCNLSNIYYITQLYEIKVGLSPNQKTKFSRAYHKRETIVLRLIKDSLTGSDTLYVPSNIVKRLDKSRKLSKGMDIKLSKSNIRKQLGGSLLSSILSMGRTLAPTIGKTLGLASLAGLASEGASQIVKKISGRGQTGGFMLPYENIEKILPYSRMLTNKQAKDIYHAMQTGSGVHIKPTKEQRGGFLGTLLASIAAPLGVDALKGITGGLMAAPQMGTPKPSPQNKTKGKGAPQMGRPKPRAPRSIPTPKPKEEYQGGLVYPPYPLMSPPFYGTWPGQTMGAGKIKAPKKKVRKKAKVYF